MEWEGVDVPCCLRMKSTATTCPLSPEAAHLTSLARSIAQREKGAR